MQPRRGDLPISAARLGLRLHGLPRSISASRSLNIGFGGEDPSDGSYHSVYDSYYHVTHFDDPGLLMARLCRRSSAGWCCAPPADRACRTAIGDFADTVGRYLLACRSWRLTSATKDRALADLIAARVISRSPRSPTDPIVAPAAQGVTPLIDMLPLEDAVDHLKRAARAADAVLSRASESLARSDPVARSTPALPRSTSC